MFFFSPVSGRPRIVRERAREIVWPQCRAGNVCEHDCFVVCAFGLYARALCEHWSDRAGQIDLFCTKRVRAAHLAAIATNYVEHLARSRSRAPAAAQHEWEVDHCERDRERMGIEWIWRGEMVGFLFYVRIYAAIARRWRASIAH